MNVYRSECGPYPMVDLLNRIEFNQRRVSWDWHTGKEIFESAFSYREIVPTQYIDDSIKDSKWEKKVLKPTKEYFFTGERELISCVLDVKNKKIVLKWSETNRHGQKREKETEHMKSAP